MKTLRASTALSVQSAIRFVPNSAGQEIPVVSVRGVDHLVVPCSMLVEGVLHSSNAAEPALALASEFGAIPEGWNGRPVVFNHPQINGEAVSANSPDLWNEGVIGFVFNAHMSDKSLVAELYVDTTRAPSEVIDGLKNGDAFEVSTGLFSQIEEISGLFQNESYSSIWRNIVPDHLAILEAGSIGACSIEDGCGIPRTNSLRANQKVYKMSAQTSGSTVQDSSKAKANETAAGSGDCGCQEPKSWMNMLPKAMQLALNKFRKRTPALAANELSDKDVRNALMSALADLEGFAYASPEAVFKDVVVFSAMEREDYEWGLFQVSYSVAEGGAVTLGADPVEVRPETRYVPVVVTGSTADVLTNSSPKELPMELTSDQITAIASAVTAQLKPAAPTAPVANSAPAVETPKPIADLAALLANASPELAAQVNSAISMAANARKATMDKLLANGYTADELKDAPQALLDKLAANIQKPPVAGAGAVDFAGAAGGVVANNAPERFTPPTPVFPVKA